MRAACIQEGAAVAVTLAGLIGIPVWVAGREKAHDPPDRRVIELTGVKKDGVWTAEAVTGFNYGAKSFGPAEIMMRPGEKVLLRLTSADVTHGFYVPDLGIGPCIVEPGHVEEIPFTADTTGVFVYYCTAVCGDCHHFMRGLIRIGEGGGEAGLAVQDPVVSCPHHRPGPGEAGSLAEHGRRLYESKGCVACHGAAGRGGVRNPNYIKGTVPRLDMLAERMHLYEREDVETILGLMERRADLEALDADAPFRAYHRFLAQYHSVREVIRNGRPAGRRDTTGVVPPLSMPSWAAALSDRDVDALIAYLLTVFPWEDGG